MKNSDASLAYDKKTAAAYKTFANKDFEGDIALFKALDRIDMTNKRVLDFGCGNGRMEKKFLTYSPAAIVGAEVSGPMIEEAKKSLETFSADEKKKISFVHIPPNALPFDDESFDICIAHFVLHYIPDTATILKEISRVLKPGGFFVATVNDFTFAQGYEHLGNTVIPLILKKSLVINVLAKTRKEIFDNLESARLNIESIDTFSTASGVVVDDYEFRDKVVHQNSIIVARKE